LPARDIYRQSLAALAWVHSSDRAKGTGWIVDVRRRWLVTCYHVVGENDTCEVVFPWRQSGAVVGPRRIYVEQMPELRKRGLAVRGRVLRRNIATDLALVELNRIPEGTRALNLSEAPARPGDRVQVAGNRYDLDVLWTHGSGSVRALRTLRDGWFNAGRQLAKGARVLLASVPVNEGDSGGPLVNEAGKVVGVCAAVAWESQGAGLFIDLPELRSLLGVSAKAPADGRSDPLSAREIYRRAMSSVAVVQYKGGTRCAGVLVDRHRKLVVTTADAVAKEETVEVTFPLEQSAGVVAEAAWYRDQRDLLRRKGAVSTGVVLGVDRRRNLSLVEAAALPAGVGEMPLAKERPSPGDSLHLISHPQRLEVLWVYSAASVRQTGHYKFSPEIAGPDPGVLVVQAPLADGEGGGPALDHRGELVGIISGKIGAQQQIGFVLNAAEIRGFLETVRPRSAPKTPAELVARGELFVLAREYDRALTEYCAALARDSKCAAAWAGRAWVHHLRRENDRALVDASTALRLDPRCVAAYCNLAAARCGRGEARKAMLDCDDAIRLDPRCALAFALRARAKLLLGDADGAIADSDEAIWLDSRLALACRVRGEAHTLKNDTVRALADFNHAVLLDPHAAEGFVKRGELHWRRNDMDAALADFDKALKLSPRDPAAVHGRGRVNAARGDHDQALADFDAVVTIAPERMAVYVDRGSERLRRGHVGTGLADMLRALRNRPVLIDQVLAEIERRTADRPTLVEQTTCAEVCGEVLQGILPFAADRKGLQRRIEQVVESARREPSAKRRAELLRAGVTAVRAAWSESPENGVPRK
jgi:S1-C subfamily serine protease/Tfp pilus assembly protein PilF